jgi:hypothetical protein
MTRPTKVAHKVLKKLVVIKGPMTSMRQGVSGEPHAP